MKAILIVKNMNLVKLVSVAFLISIVILIIVVIIMIKHKKNNSVFGLIEKIFKDIRYSEEIENNKYFNKAIEYNLIEKVKVEKNEYKLTESGIKFLFQSYNENNSLLEKALVAINIIITVALFIINIANIFLQSINILNK